VKFDEFGQVQPNNVLTLITKKSELSLAEWKAIQAQPQTGEIFEFNNVVVQDGGVKVLEPTQGYQGYGKQNVGDLLRFVTIPTGKWSQGKQQMESLLFVYSEKERPPEQGNLADVGVPPSQSKVTVTENQRGIADYTPGGNTPWNPSKSSAEYIFYSDTRLPKSGGPGG
jgi:hypothetical protein